MFKIPCPQRAELSLEFPLAVLHRSEAELHCRNCKARFESNIPLGRWWLLRTLFAIIGVSLIPFLFLFFWGRWWIWAIAIAVLFGLEAALAMWLHLRSYRKLSIEFRQPRKRRSFD